VLCSVWYRKDVANCSKIQDVSVLRHLIPTRDKHWSKKYHDWHNSIRIILQSESKGINSWGKMCCLFIPLNKETGFPGLSRLKADQHFCDGRGAWVFPSMRLVETLVGPHQPIAGRALAYATGPGLICELLCGKVPIQVLTHVQLASADRCIDSARLLVLG
jgi:hypothetical protein